MTITKDFANIYKEYLRVTNDYKKHIKQIENMKRKVEKKQAIATEEEVNLIEKEELTEDDELTCNKDKIYFFSNGDKYIGKIEKNDLHGKGYYIMYDDGEMIMEYTGDFVNNLRDGVGQCRLRNGNLYIGEFKEDIISGTGQMNYKNGDEYIGQWENNKKHGIGMFTWNDKVRYNGEFKGGKMDGEGQCFDEHGNLIYQGEWKNNLIHGEGTYIWNEGKRYEGEFMYGKKHGKGKFYLNGELIYDGTWKFDKPSVLGRSLDELFSIKL